MSTGSVNSQGQQPIIIQMPKQPGFFQSWFSRLLLSALMFSVFLNFMLVRTQATTTIGGSPREEYVSGSHTATQRIAVITIEGTIMPPFTNRWIKQIEAARDDDDVKGVVLVVDSPGGLVADSHQIYHRLKQVSAKKPIYVSMKRMAASGGVYVSMGAGESGKIFAEPTTWTGSIGVIIPRYDLSGLAEKFGVSSDSLTTGPLKDSLNPLRPLTEKDREVWTAIMNDSFDRFVKIVDEGRKPLDEQTVREKLATGQVFTATQAKEFGLIDDIAFEDEVIEHLKKDLSLTDVRVIKYAHDPTLTEILLGEVETRDPQVFWRKAMESTVPKAMYLCSWLPAL